MKECACKNYEMLFQIRRMTLRCPSLGSRMLNASGRLCRVALMNNVGTPRFGLPNVFALNWFTEKKTIVGAKYIRKSGLSAGNFLVSPSRIFITGDKFESLLRLSDGTGRSCWMKKNRIKNLVKCLSLKRRPTH
jgi:hypothetical protein